MSAPLPEERSLLGQPARYAQGLRAVGDGVYAWLQPNGGLGESNAGLIVGDGESLLIDTLFDPRLTRRMLAAMQPHAAGAPIRRLVNTHGDPDHCWGNQLLPGAEIIATRAGAQDMGGDHPRTLRMLSELGRVPDVQLPLPGAGKLAGLTTFARALRSFDFGGIMPTPPTVTFTDKLELDVGGRRVELLEVGPAHAPGDLIVHVPDAAVVFAADLLFVNVTPLMWVGPVENWVAGLDRIVELGPRTVVPGHGPVSDLEGVRALRAYWELVAPAVRQRVAGGVSPADAAREIVTSPEFSTQPFARWDGPERIVVNAAIIVRNDRGEHGRVSDLVRMRLFAQMGELAAELRGRWP